MLIGIDPLLHPELLHTLRAMGHGDEIALVDANFPATSNARRLHRLDGVDILRAGEAILSVLPLDSFISHPVLRMQVVNTPDEIPPVQEEFQTLVNHSAGRELPMGSLERHTFYHRARDAFAVVSTGERRGYGCFLITKGVLKPDGSVWW